MPRKPPESPELSLANFWSHKFWRPTWGLKGKEVNFSKFIFNDYATVISHIPKKNRSVLLASSMHAHGSIDDNPGQKKPEIIMFYNLTKGGVDKVDEMKELYSVSQAIAVTSFFFQ
jgi:hypothetical protein